MTLKTCQKDLQIVTDKSLLLLVSPHPPSCVPGALDCPGGYTASCDVKEMSQRARGRSQPVIYSSLAGGMRSICRGENQSLTQQPLGQPILGVITLSAATSSRSVHVHPSVY